MTEYIETQLPRQAKEKTGIPKSTATGLSALYA